MFQSIIIVDPKSEIKGKQDSNTYVVSPTILDRRESIRIKDVQEMLMWCAKSAFHGEEKRVVIEQLHKGSDAVPHALLKLLEEPPANTTITITIDRAESALSTIRSRCAILSIDDMDSAQLAKLGLVKEVKSNASSAISWNEFADIDQAGQFEWLAGYVKGKKDSAVLVQAWQLELAERLHSGQATDYPREVRQLALLEEIGAALRQNVLPRLALQYLWIKLQQT